MEQNAREGGAASLPFPSTHWFVHLHCDIVRNRKKMLVICGWSDRDSYNYALSAHCNGNSRSSEWFAMTNTNPTTSLPPSSRARGRTPKIKCMRTVNSFYRGLATQFRFQMHLHVRAAVAQCTIFLFPASHCSRDIRDWQFGLPTYMYVQLDPNPDRSMVMRRG
jgi:hypothetical protein